MSKILVNNNPTPVIVDDCGVTVPPNSTYTIDPNDYDVFAASSDIIRLFSDETLILNDGGNDITDLSDAVDIIKGWPTSGGTTVIAEGEPFFFDYSDIPIGPGPHTLISFSNGGAVNMNLSRVEVACRIEAFIEIQKNGEVIGSVMTGASRPKDYFQAFPSRPISPGDLVEVILTKRTGGPDVSIAAHVMGRLAT